MEFAKLAKNLKLTYGLLHDLTSCGQVPGVKPQGTCLRDDGDKGLKVRRVECLKMMLWAAPTDRRDSMAAVGSQEVRIRQVHDMSASRGP